MISLEKLKELEHEYFKTNNEIDLLENKLIELKDHKARLRFFYDTYKQDNEVIIKWLNKN